MKRSKAKPAIDVSPILIRLGAIEDRVRAVHETVAKLAQHESWVGVHEFAQLHGIHPCTVRRAAKRGDLDVRRVGRRVLIRMRAEAPASQR